MEAFAVLFQVFIRSRNPLCGDRAAAVFATLKCNVLLPGRDFKPVIDHRPLVSILDKYTLWKIPQLNLTPSSETYKLQFLNYLEFLNYKARRTKLLMPSL